MSDDDGERTREDHDHQPPLADLAERVEARRDARAEPAVDDRFSEETFDALDEGGLWGAIEADEPSNEGSVTIDGETTVVSKRDFCERCQYFAEPPEARCTHDSTEIREFVDRAQVRVYNCPVVEERGQLGTGIDD